MYIKDLILKNYKKFNNKQIHFKNGLNFVIGKNEAGKSTILSGLLDALYVDAATKAVKKYLSGVISWGKEIKPVLETTLVTENAEYTVLKNFNTGEGVLRYRDVEYIESVQISEIVAKLLNIPSREVYAATGLIKQEQISSSRKKDSLVSVVQASVEDLETGADVGVVLKNIKKELREFEKGLKGVSKTPGAKKLWTEKIFNLKTELTTTNDLKIHLVDLQNSLESDSEIFAVKKKKIGVLEVLLKNNDLRIKAKQQIDQIDQQLKNIVIDRKETQQVGDEIKKLEQNKRIAAERFAMRDTDADAQKLNELEGESVGYIGQARILEDEILDIRVGEFRIWLVITVLLLVAVFFISIIILKVLAGIAAIIGGIFVGKNLLNLVSTNKVKQKIENYTALAGMSKEDQVKIFDMYGVSSVEQFISEYNNYKNLDNEIAEKEISKNRVLRGRTPQEIEHEEISLLQKKKEIEVNILTEEVRSTVLDSTELTETRIEFQTLAEETKELSDNIIRLRTKIEDANIPNEKLFEMQYSLEEAERNLLHIDHKIQVLEKTQKYIETTVNDRIAVAGDILRKYIEKYMSQITDGKYSKAKVDKALNIMVYAEEKKEWIEPELWLSTGTVDVINLLARISYFDLISKSAPILMDDPFVSIDSERRKKVFKVMTELAKDRQIIVFTHNEGYSDIPDANYIAL